MKIAVIGTGYVGLTTGIGLSNFGSDVICLDVDENKIATLKSGIMPFYEPGMQEVLTQNIKNGRLTFSTCLEDGIKSSDVIFIAVGTPQGDNGRADLGAVYEVAGTIGRNLNNCKIIVTKSTVPVGANENIKSEIQRYNYSNTEFDIVSNPEFLREGRALYDFLHPDRVVIGVENDRPKETMQNLYRPLYLSEVPFVFTNLRTAEMIKYSSNCFLATKVAFINEMSRLCDVTGADIHTVASAMGRDGRIGGKFLHPSPGYGGSCFPKDTEAMACIGRDNNMPMSIIETVIDSNKRHKKYILEKILKEFTPSVNHKIGILGLSFKSETDDMRESAAIDVINGLLEYGFIVSVFDPQAISNAKKIWGEAIFYGTDEYNAISECDGLVILTEWNQFRNLNLDRVFQVMSGNKFFDFRNIYQPNEVEKFGFSYIGLGRN